MAKDFYKVLGVSRSADDKTIKSAYRKLARKYHPDVNPGDKAAEAKFKEISEANEVLSDPEKRKAYDRFGENYENMSGGGDFGGVNFDFGGGGIGSIFEQFFHTAPAEGSRPKGVEAKDLTKEIIVPLEEIDKGTSRTLSYQVQDSCKSCDGTGFVRLKSSRTCPVCQGSGAQRGMFGMSQPCEGCGGTGKSTLERCPTCSGDGVVLSNKRVEVKIPAGIPEGRKLRVPGRGSVGANGRAGDLYVVVKAEKHFQFERKGDDLETEVPVSLTTAVLGGEVRVPTLRGTLTMKINEGSQPGQTLRLANQGMTKLNSNQRGDLFVKLKIALPKNLTPEQRELFEKMAQAEVKA